MLKKTLLSILLLTFAAPLYAAPDKYDIDKQHTHILFSVSHIGFSKTIGIVREFSGSFTFDEKEPAKSVIDFSLNPASIDTNVPPLDKELSGDKFLNVKIYKTIHFKSIAIVVTGEKTGDVTGNLTLLGVTKPVVLHVTYNKSGIHPYTNNYVSGFSADATFKRSDFGMNAYIPSVGDDVEIHIEIEGTDPVKHPGNIKVPNGR